MLFFNTAGPVNFEDHYAVNLLERPQVKDILRLIEQKKYFVLHAPRQTGKTSLLLAIANELNKKGDVKALYLNVEPSVLYLDNPGECFKSIIFELASRARDYLDDSYPEEKGLELLQQKGPGFALNELLTLWSKNSEKPIVLLIDEVDKLEGDVLASFLKQLRAGFDKRPKLFPQSIILCGVEDIRYKIVQKDDDKDITGGDLFNIEAKSIELSTLTQPEIENVLQDLKKDREIDFSEDAAKRLYEITRGQPWLVNAIAYEIVEEMVPRKANIKKITKIEVDEAMENIIQRQEIHIKSLMDRLKEDRVRKVITPILIGSDFPEELSDDDLRYLTELGIIQLNNSGMIDIANPIYHEIIPRALVNPTKRIIRYDLANYLDENANLNIHEIMRTFQPFFRKHAPSWNEQFLYREAGSHLFLQAYLQRIIDGGGSITRYYGISRNQISLVLNWPHGMEDQTFIVSSRDISSSVKSTMNAAVPFLQEEMKEHGLSNGHLVLFYPMGMKSYERKAFHQVSRFDGGEIEIWGM